ncbi:hypothetical protein JST56_02115 [Candidatus Dependentiae bacterium]|nr:hypothetical protein [Candidatus Dependentiae bacterium]
MNGKSTAALFFGLFIHITCSPILNFRSSTSGINITEGAGLVLSNKIQDCQGKVTKATGASISGREIVFNKGTFVDGNNRMKIAGTYRTGDANKILLNGNESFRGGGISVAQAIEVRNGNNRLEGEILLSNNLVLHDSNASVTCAITRSLAQDIELNGGTLYLEENLSFIDDKKIVGNGTIVCNARKIILGAKEMSWNGSIYFDNGNDIELKSTLHLCQTWTFSGYNSTIVGNGNILMLEPHGKIVVERGANLLLKNMVIQNVALRNIRCLDGAGKIIFQDVVLVQNDDFIFDKGSFDVYGSLDLISGYTFVFQPTAECTIQSASTLALSNNVTLSVDFITTRTDLLAFADSSAALRLKNSTLYVTPTGIQLKNGSLIFDGVCNIYATDKRNVSKGVTIGSGQNADDCTMEIRSGAWVNLINGTLIYRNINPNALIFKNSLSVLQIDTLALLKLNQPFDVDPGKIRIAGASSVVQDGLDYLQGSVEFFIESSL